MVLFDTSVVCIVGNTYSLTDRDTKKQNGVVHKHIVKYARI